MLSFIFHPTNFILQIDPTNFVLKIGVVDVDDTEKQTTLLAVASEYAKEVKVNVVKIVTRRSSTRVPFLSPPHDLEYPFLTAPNLF